MPEVATGSCLCGAVRFSYEGPIGSAAYCHCTDCRRCTGSAFNISIGFEAAHFEIIGHTPASYTKQADSGHELTRHFCPNCGSPIYTSSPKFPGLFFIKAGIIDDPTLVRPGYQSWVRSAVPWSKIDAGLPAHEKAR
jgi:hypothetical protein